MDTSSAPADQVFVLRLASGSETQTCVVTIGTLLRAVSRSGQFSLGHNHAQCSCCFHLLTQQVADALIRGQEIVIAAIQRSADTQLLRAAPPMHHVVSRSQRREPTQVMHIDFAGMTRHGLGESEYIGATAAQEI